MYPKLLFGLLSVSFIISSCKKGNVSEEDQAVDNIHFTADFDGEEKSFKNGIDNYGNTAVSSFDGAEEYQYTSFAQTGGGGPFINIGLIKGIGFATDGSDWEEGTYAFGERASYNGGTTVEGAVIEYYDPSAEKYWSTDLAWGLQTGALAITSLEEDTDGSGMFVADMNCSFTLYSSDSTIIKVTDAVIRGEIGSN